MKYVQYLALVAVAGLVMSLSSIAQAKSKDNGALNLADAVQVGSTKVAPGDYKVETTMFTIFPGTTITLTICLPAIRL